MKRIIYLTLGLFLFWGSVQGIDTVSAETQQAASPAKVIKAPTVVITNATPLEVVKNPYKYQNVTIVMKATFDKFSTLGLDYKRAFRSSEEYIGILIKRDDIVDHTVPLSEMKLFLKRNLAEKNINLEAGDKIEIKGRIFSTALGDPWIDVQEINVIQKAEKSTKK